MRILHSPWDPPLTWGYLRKHFWGSLPIILNFVACLPAYGPHLKGSYLHCSRWRCQLLKQCCDWPPTDVSWLLITGWHFKQEGDSCLLRGSGGEQQPTAYISRKIISVPFCVVKPINPKSSFHSPVSSVCRLKRSESYTEVNAIK